MNEEDFSVDYQITVSERIRAIEGKTYPEGETVFIDMSIFLPEYIEETAGVLNREKVSLSHAKDVVRDRVLRTIF